MALVSSVFFEAYKRSGLLVSATWTPHDTGVTSLPEDVYLTSQEVDGGVGAAGVLSMQRTVTFPIGVFAGIQRGDLVTIGLVSYYVIEPFQSDDLFMMATLARRKQ